MNINEILDNSKFYEALIKTKYFKDKDMNHWALKSGRLPLPRFTKLQNFLLESLYTISDLHNPSAYRIYLYLLRQITGYKSKSSIEYRPKKIKAELNMGNSFYKAERILKEKNMIRYEFIKDIKYLGLNPYPETWITDSKDEINEIINNEVNELLGIQKDALSSSSSSWSCSSTSSSSQSFPSDDEYLLSELDEFEKVRPDNACKKTKPKYHPMFEPVTPDEIKQLDELDGM